VAFLKSLYLSAGTLSSHQIGIEIWVLHVFQKKSTQGVKTPKHEIDLVDDRLKRLKEVLK
jgi:phage-related protein